MSRCFPFPPPGYEPKYRIEDIQILKKEKHREKKHKKEKEKKREGKEKRDKERSDGKHKENKEKKEKQKDKKKDKEKDGDKHKVSTSDKKKPQEQSEVQREEKISNQKQHLAHVKGSGGEKIIYKEDRKRERIDLSAERRSAGPFTGYDEDKIGNNSNPGVVKISKSVEEFGKTAKGGSRESGNQLLGKVSGTGHNKDQVRSAARPSEICADQKNNRTRVDGRQIDDKAFSNQTGCIGRTAVQNLAESVQVKTAGVLVSSEKYPGKKMEIKEKNKENGGGNKYGDVQVNENRENKVQGLRIGDKEKQEKPKGKNEDAHVNRDRENKVQGLRIGDKERREKPKEKIEHQLQLQDESRESNHCGLLGTQHAITPHLAKDSKRTGAVDGTTKKRKHPEANGILHVKDKRSSKVARPTPCLTENGSSLRDSQTAISSTNKRHGIATERTVVNKEQKFNGVQEAALTSSVPVRTSPATVQNCNIIENNVKSPHPDLKYLSKLLVVPEMEELPYIVDEEWLFSNSDVKSEKPNKNSRDTPQVWAEALQIDSPDFWVLPYVIPY